MGGKKKPQKKPKKKSQKKAVTSSSSSSSSHVPVSLSEAPDATSDFLSEALDAALLTLSETPDAAPISLSTAPDAAPTSLSEAPDAVPTAIGIPKPVNILSEEAYRRRDPNAYTGEVYDANEENPGLLVAAKRKQDRENLGLQYLRPYLESLVRSDGAPFAVVATNYNTSQSSVARDALYNRTHLAKQMTSRPRPPFGDTLMNQILFTTGLTSNLYRPCTDVKGPTDEERAQGRVLMFEYRPLLFDIDNEDVLPSTLTLTVCLVDDAIVEELDRRELAMHETMRSYMDKDKMPSWDSISPCKRVNDVKQFAARLLRAETADERRRLRSDFHATSTRPLRFLLNPYSSDSTEGPVITYDMLPYLSHRQEAYQFDRENKDASRAISIPQRMPSVGAPLIHQMPHRLLVVYVHPHTLTPKTHLVYHNRTAEEVAAGGDEGVQHDMKAEKVFKLRLPVYQQRSPLCEGPVRMIVSYSVLDYGHHLWHEGGVLAAIPEFAVRRFGEVAKYACRPQCVTLRFNLERSLPGVRPLGVTVYRTGVLAKIGKGQPLVLPSRTHAILDARRQLASYVQRETDFDVVFWASPSVMQRWRKDDADAYADRSRLRGLLLSNYTSADARPNPGAEDRLDPTCTNAMKLMCGGYVTEMGVPYANIIHPEVLARLVSYKGAAR